ncbi:MAG: lipocalin family protein [Bdellovibrionales bacterium]|nr:lipocalin family protein [Bdellovibrionales bacterium]
MKAQYPLLRLFTLLLAPALLAVPPALASEPPELQVVPRLDPSRYAGTWYEIASFPQNFQRGCVATKAEYRLRPDGDIDVRNSCRRDRLDGELREAHGKAWITDPTTNAKLRVRFFWPFSGKYWVIELGEEYEYAVVGHPNRDYLWILSRTPQLPEETYERLLQRLEDVHHYDLTRLKKTLQP